jgi:hypothetical protein
LQTAEKEKRKVSEMENKCTRNTQREDSMSYKLNVVYDPYDYRVAVPDALAKDTAGGFVSLVNKYPGQYTYTVSNEIVILWLRISIAKGLIKAKDVRVIYNDQVITFDKNGRCETWPEGFCDWYDKAVEKLV